MRSEGTEGPTKPKKLKVPKVPKVQPDTKVQLGETTLAIHETNPWHLSPCCVGYVGAQLPTAYNHSNASIAGFKKKYWDAVCP